MYIELRNVNFVNLMKYELNVCVLYVTLDIYPISQAKIIQKSRKEEVTFLFPVWDR